MKYNFDELHWQEFEILSFKCLQKLVSPSIQFLEGGKDKGRDIVFNGKSNSFLKDWEGKWVFQIKHKSNFTDTKKLYKSLLYDLDEELNKIFIRYKFNYDNYILVTNIPVTPDIFDKANALFFNFCKNNSIECENFFIIGYRHLETCIEENGNIKWLFPNIITHPDFEALLKKIFSSQIDNRTKGWLKSITETRKFFVHTNIFDEALTKLDSHNIILMSGPPKSGKTYNAEILALYYLGQMHFDVLRIDEPEEIEKFYDQTKKQYFLCDDAFGLHELSYSNAEDWDRKLISILSLADENHKFVFTSRIHIYRAFLNYVKNFEDNYLEKVLVESSKLSDGERSAILYKYLINSSIDEEEKKFLLKFEDQIINHKNFSPETVRSFFILELNKAPSKLLLKELFFKHLERPDAYLENVFANLESSRKIIVLAVLCAFDNKIEDIAIAYSNLSSDLQTSQLSAYKLILDELDGGIIKLHKDEEITEVYFYHPSMQEYLLQLIQKDNYGTLKSAVLKNFNITLLNLSFFCSTKVPLTTHYIIEIKHEELKNFTIGVTRLLKYRTIKIYHLIRILSWLSSSEFAQMSKLLDKPFFVEIKKIIHSTVEWMQTEEFYPKFQNESATKWSEIIWRIKSIIMNYGIETQIVNKRMWISLLNSKRNDNEYWKMVLRLSSILDTEIIKNNVGKDWLNNFYTELKKQIYELGEEIFGKDFPDFNHYNSLTNEEKIKPENQKMKNKPNKTWFPRFINCNEKYKCLKEIKGNEIGKEILERIEKPFEEILRFSDYARNRHLFIKEKGWW